MQEQRAIGLAPLDAVTKRHAYTLLTGGLCGSSHIAHGVQMYIYTLFVQQGTWQLTQAGTQAEVLPAYQQALLLVVPLAPADFLAV